MRLEVLFAAKSRGHDMHVIHRSDQGCMGHGRGVERSAVQRNRRGEAGEGDGDGGGVIARNTEDVKARLDAAVGRFYDDDDERCLVRGFVHSSSLRWLGVAFRPLQRTLRPLSLLSLFPRHRSLPSTQTRQLTAGVPACSQYTKNGV